MKTVLSTLCLIFGLTLLPRTCLGTPRAILENPSALISPEKMRKNPSGFPMVWGISPQEVIQGERLEQWKEKDLEGALFLEAPSRDLGGYPCKATYSFIQGKLDTVFYTFRENLLDLNGSVEAFGYIQSLLEEKYGTPLEQEVLWLKEKSPYKNKPGSYGMAVALEYLVYRTAWNTGEGEIFLTLRGKSFRPLLTLEYRSPFSPGIDQIRRNHFLSHL